MSKEEKIDNYILITFFIVFFLVEFIFGAGSLGKHPEEIIASERSEIIGSLFAPIFEAGFYFFLLTIIATIIAKFSKKLSPVNKKTVYWLPSLTLFFFIPMVLLASFVWNILFLR